MIELWFIEAEDGQQIELEGSRDFIERFMRNPRIVSGCKVPTTPYTNIARAHSEVRSQLTGALIHGEIEST